MIRLRQLALVASDLDAVVSELCERLGLTVCYHDPGVGEFGLHNALMVIGDQFLEVVSPTQEVTTAGRLIDKRGGDGGYMAIFEVDDLDTRMERLDELGVRTVWAGDFATIRGRHLHPRDVGGAIVSIDQPIPNGSWTWAGPDWTAHEDSTIVAGIAGVTVGAADPDAMRARWTEIGIDTSVDFAQAGERGDGIDAIDLVAADRRLVGTTHHIGGVDFRLV